MALAVSVRPSGSCTSQFRKVKQIRDHGSAGTWPAGTSTHARAKYSDVVENRSDLGVAEHPFKG